jgi:hypothetical protein
LGAGCLGRTNIKNAGMTNQTSSVLWNTDSVSFINRFSMSVLFVSVNSDENGNPFLKNQLTADSCC